MDLTAASNYGDAYCSRNHSIRHCRTNLEEDAATVPAFLHG